MQSIIGVDPGKTGGVAVIHPDGSAYAVRMPESPSALAEFVRELARNTTCDLFAYVEKVGVRPEEGAVGAFTFGKGCGAIEGVFAMAKIPFVFVTPQKWQKVVFDSAKKVSDRKAMSLDLARRLWPHVDLRFKVDDGKAEALLIAEYGRRQNPLVPEKGDWP